MDKVKVSTGILRESGATPRIIIFIAAALAISQTIVFLFSSRLGETGMAAIFFFVTAAILSIFYFYLKRIIFKPFNEMTESLKKITSGDMSERVNSEGVSEMNKLANSINVMTESMDHKFSQLTNLIEISKDSISNLSFQEVLNHILESAVDSQGAKSGSIMLLNKRTNELEIAAAVNMDKEIVKSTRVKLGEGIAGRVAKDGEPLLLIDGVTLCGQRNLKDAVSIPIKSKDELIGVLNLNSKGPRSAGESSIFDVKDLDFLSTLANHAAVVINNAHLYEVLQKNYINIIQTLTAAIDAKDPSTRGHSARVAEYAVAIAKELKMPMESLKTIQSAAYLHDVGKIGIPEYILGKPSGLTDAEFDIIKTHPTISAKILAPVHFEEPIIPIVRHHHERYAGGGYPDNIKGDMIPLEARILTLADSFDAMISSRPYRSAHSVDWAMEEIRNCSGQQFDPEIAEVFLQVIDAMFRPAFVDDEPEPNGSKPTKIKEAIDNIPRSKKAAIS